MKSYEEIDQMDKPVKLLEFLATMVIVVGFSVFFAWVFVYFIPFIGSLVIR